MHFINGLDRSQTELLPDSIEEYVDKNNPVRVIDAFINSLDMSELGFERSIPGETGRPPYNPRDLLKLYVYGYMNRTRSSRRLEKETKRNLELMWLMCRLSPDHKTISRFRSGNPKALKNVFRAFAKLCDRLGLYGKEIEALDGSKFKAVNSKERNFTLGKLEDRISRIDKKIDKYLEELDDNDRAEDEEEKEKTAVEIKDIIEGLKNRKIRYEEYADELEKTGKTQKSLTDPDSRLMKANGKMDVCYNVQTVVDSKHKLITEFEVTNHPEDANQIQPMYEMAAEQLETRDFSITADAGYSSIQDIAASIQTGADIHVAGTDFEICVPTQETDAEITEHKNGRCVYFKDRNIVLCPMGKVLYPGYYKKEKKQGVFHNRAVCKSCTCKCTKEKRGKHHEVPMKEEAFSENYDDGNLFVKQIKIKADRKIVSQRKSVVEHPFGTIKRSMDAAYCLTKGIRKVRAEFSLVFLAYNIKRAVNILGSKKLVALCVV